MKLHHFADPEKNQEWLRRTKHEMADTPRQFEVEILMKELVLEGQPVFPNFYEPVHAPLILDTKQLRPEPYSRFILGWDCGTASVQPVAVLLEITARGTERGMLVRAMMEVTSEPGTSLVLFTPLVLNEVRRVFPEISLSAIEHAGDESGRARQGATGESAFEVMQRHGVVCRPISNAWHRRRSSVDRLLARQAAENVPMFVVNRALCPLLLEGFLGGYRLRMSGHGSRALFGDPVKDRFSHPHDALQYAAVVAWEMIEGGSVERFSRI